MTIFNLFILFGHGSGYLLFRVDQLGELSMLLSQDGDFFTDFFKFNSLVKFVAFKPFQSANISVKNIEAISKGILLNNLIRFIDKFFLNSNLKNENCAIGVTNSKLGEAITTATGIQSTYDNIVQTVIKGIQLHFYTLVGGYTYYIRNILEIKPTTNWNDIKDKLFDKLHVDVIEFSRLIRGWYSCHFPELNEILRENYMYSRAIKLINDCRTLTHDKFIELEQIVSSSAKAQEIIEASKISTGMVLNQEDLNNVVMYAEYVTKLYEFGRLLAPLYLRRDNQDNFWPPLRSYLLKFESLRLK